MNTAGQRSVFSRIMWMIYGVILICVLGFLCYRIYLVSTGQAWSYGHEPVAPQRTEALDTQQVDTSHYATTQEVQSLAKIPLIKTDQIGGDEHTATFRNQAGSIVCTITTDIDKYPLSDWIPMPVGAQGAQVQGSGFVCGVVSNIPIHGEDTQGCPEGSWLAGSALGYTDSTGSLVGSCMNDNPPLNKDTLNAGNKHNQEVKTLPLGYRIQVGNYSCAFESLKVTCADMHSGAGMWMSEDDYAFFSLPSSGEAK